MSVEKSKLKAAVAHQIGGDTDDDLEAARRDVLRAEGRMQAAQALEKEIQKIAAKLDADMDSDEPPFPDLESAKNAKRYLGFVLAQAATVAQRSDQLRLQAQGRAAAFEHTIKRLVKFGEAEMGKAEVVLAAQAAANAGADEDIDVLRERPVGTHPGPSLADRRRSEDDTVSSPPDAAGPDAPDERGADAPDA
jgi:hypothetical protein